MRKKGEKSGKMNYPEVKLKHCKGSIKIYGFIGKIAEDIMDTDVWRKKTLDCPFSKYHIAGKFLIPLLTAAFSVYYCKLIWDYQDIENKTEC